MTGFPRTPNGASADWSRRSSAAVAASVVALTLVGTCSAAGNRGIDVSHWNRVRNWSSVAAAGYGFAYVKATDGTRGVDRAYGRYRNGASAVGLRVGAYHFARPAGRRRAAWLADARAEARHFVAVAQPRPGDLVPVLDLEETGGLGPAALISWTSAWLGEIERQLSVQPVIYASVRFWRVAMANTTVFGEVGHGLWLARWTRAPAPSVPGLDWAGFGWTFWQWTSCGRVAGINGCVDLDRFNGDDLSTVLLGDPAINLEPPAIEGTATIGQTLTADPGGWAGSQPIRLQYAWERCDALGANCAPVPGAIAQTYTLTSLDEGHTIVVAVAGSNRVGSDEATSPPTVVVP